MDNQVRALWGEGPSSTVRLATLTNDVGVMAMAARSAVAHTRKESKGVA